MKIELRTLQVAVMVVPWPVSVVCVTKTQRMSLQFTRLGGACNKLTASASWLSGDLISRLKRWARLKDGVDPGISSIHIQIWLTRTVKYDLSLRYYRATFSVRNGVKWLLWDTGKIGEASDEGELSCLNKVGETFQSWKLPLKILERGRSFQGDFEIGETYQFMEVVSSSRKSQRCDRRALLRIPIPCHHMDRYHKTTHQAQQQLDPRKQ